MNLRLRIPVLALAVVPLAGQGQPSGGVASVRHWSLEGATRVAIETGGDVPYHVEVLQNPDRLFVDLRDSVLQMGKRFVNLPVGDNLVKQIRVAQSQKDVVRVVLDLTGAVEYEVSKLSAPNRVMIEVRAKAVAEPATPARGLETGAPAPPGPAPAAQMRVNVPSGTPPPAIAGTPAPAGAGGGQGARPAKKNSDGSRNLTRALGLKLERVVIDPGHGGNDHGTTGPTGLQEKDLALDVATRLGALLEEKLGTQVTYTRRDDTFVPLEERTAIANRSKADLFLSVHANSSASSRAYGTETYYLRFTTSKEELDVAARENAGTTRSVHELQDLVRQIALQEKAEESREFAARVQMSLNGVWARSGNPTRNRGLKKAPFVVLIGARMPSVLTEIGFLSNPREEGQLKKPEYRQKVAEALYKGIAQYVSTLSRFDLAKTTGN